MTASLENVAAVVLASRGGARLASALDGVAWAGERIVLDPAGRLGAEPLPDGVRWAEEPAEAARAAWLLLVEEHEAVRPSLVAAIASALEAPGARAYRIAQEVIAFGTTLRLRHAPVRLARRDGVRLRLRTGLTPELAAGGGCRPAARGERARAAGARAGGRALGALDARRAGRLSRPGRLRQALGDAPGGGSAPAVRVPASYALLRSGAVRAAIRSDLVPALGAWLLAPRLELPPGAAPIASGRGPAYRMRLGDGAPVVVRICRRGGLAARLVRETYLGLRPRPLRELALTVEARRRGVAAAEVLAARVEGRLAYRGALVTAEVPAAATLLEALRGAPDRAARRGLAAAAGRAVAELHAAGVFHADLNLRNILVHPGPEGVRAALLDFDRAWLGAPPLRTAARRRNLRRLARSLAKLDPEGQLAGAEERRAFRDAYTGHDPRLALGDACGC